MEHQLLRFFNPGIQDLIPGFLRFLQDSFIWIANLRLMVGLGRAECGWYSRSQLTEEVSGIRSVAGAFAICLAHDPLFADLVLSVVSIHVALDDGDGSDGWIGEGVFGAEGTSVIGALREAHFQGFQQAGQELNQICRLFGQNGHISFVLATQETSQKGTQQALDISTMI